MDQIPGASAHDRTLETALAWHQDGRGAALAMVVETWGSAPRPVGSLLAISGRGEMAGSVSGGCVEGAVVAEALDMLAGPRSATGPEPGQHTGTGSAPGRLLTYGVSDGDAFAVGLACGGTIRVLVEPVGSVLPEHLLQEIARARAARRPVAYVVNTGTWDRCVADGQAFPERFRADRSGFAQDTDAGAGKGSGTATQSPEFVAIHNPPLRLAVVGAVHIAQPLMAMARLAGFDAALIDPRDAFAAQDRFPGERILPDWPDEALAEYGLDPRTAVVTLTHDPKLDDPAIRAALASPAFYLGCLGSKRTHAKRLERLAAEGIPPEALARIHAPVGLDIGASSPAEIALSILAQITQVLRRG